VGLDNGILRLTSGSSSWTSLHIYVTYLLRLIQDFSEKTCFFRGKFLGILALAAGGVPEFAEIEDFRHFVLFTCAWLGWAEAGDVREVAESSVQFGEDDRPDCRITGGYCHAWNRLPLLARESGPFDGFDDCCCKVVVSRNIPQSNVHHAGTFLPSIHLCDSLTSLHFQEFSTTQNSVGFRWAELLFGLCILFLKKPFTSISDLMSRFVRCTCLS